MNELAAPDINSAKHMLKAVADPTGTLPAVQLYFEDRIAGIEQYGAYTDDVRIGYINLGARDDEYRVSFMVMDSNIDEGLRGKGYGFSMYLGAAALAYASGNEYQLSSDIGIGVTPDAARLWSRLESHSVAKIQEFFKWNDERPYSYQGHAKFLSFDQIESLYSKLG